MIELEMLDKLMLHENTEQGAEDIIKAISKNVSDSGMLVDCMDIDGIKVYDDYEKYIRENSSNIQHIKVGLITLDKLVRSILDNTYSYIEGALPKLQQLIDSFYTGVKDADKIDDLSDIVEGIAWIYSTGKEILAMKSENKCIMAVLDKKYEENMERLGSSFGELKDAIMNMDYILIADILNYEVLDVFNSIRESMEN